MGDHQSNIDGGGDGAIIFLVMMAVRVVYTTSVDDGNCVDHFNGVDGGVDDDNGVDGNVNGGSGVDDSNGVDDNNGVDGDWWQRREDSIALMIEHIWERYWKSQRVMIPARAIVRVHQSAAQPQHF